MRQRLASGVLYLIGLLLALNPLYLDRLLTYPSAGDGFGVRPLFFAAFTGLGLLLLVSSAVLLFGERSDAKPASVIIGSSVSTIAVAICYLWVLQVSVDPRQTHLFGYGHRKTIVLTTVVVAFAFWAGVTAGMPEMSLLAPLLYLPGIVLVLLGQQSLFTTILDHLLLVVSNDVLGIPLLGSMLLVAAALYGSWFGRQMTKTVG